MNDVKNTILEVKDLSVSVGGKPVLKNINFRIEKDKVVVLFGPNGSGKTTLINVLMGFSGYEITSGEIILKGQKINDLSIEKRVKLGLGIMHQYPATIRGVKLGQLSDYLCEDKGKVEDLAQRLSLTEHLRRDVNLGFSGGEKKKSELFQVNLQDADVLLLDEPESGIDLENIAVMGEVLNEYFHRPGKTGLIITHSGYILDYIKAKWGCLLMDGGLWCSGRPPKVMFEEIKEEGYQHCRECHAAKQT